MAVDVPSVGAGSGVRGRKAGWHGARPPGGACDVGGRGWSPRLFRSAWTLRTGFGWGSEGVLEDNAEESDEKEGFSVGGVSDDRVGSTRGDAGDSGREPLLMRKREGLDSGVREQDGITVLDVQE